MRTSILTVCLLVMSAVHAAEIADGYSAYVQRDYETAYRIWKPLAEKGHPDAQWYLGRIYDQGHGRPQNDEQALKWYTLAAEQGKTAAQLSLGLMYQNRKSVQDLEEAVKWYTLAAEQGDTRAQYKLGSLYAEGWGGRIRRELTRDLVKAHAWFNLAATKPPYKGDIYRQIVEMDMTPDQITEAQSLAREWAAEYNND